jgi:4-amino-4-deoxy-L-arabinose transferase-like glycosyltransferase
MGRRSSDRVPVAGLVLLALALRLVGIGAGLPEVYEEAYPFKVAWKMWGWGPGHFDLNPHWFKYPGLTIDLQFLGQGLLYLLLSVFGQVRSTVDFRILHQLDPSAFYLLGRSMTAILGALTVIPVFLLARRVAGSGAAIAAAVLVAVSPALIVKSRVIEVDAPLTLMVAWGLLAAVRLSEGLTIARALVAGVVTGLATGTKYPGVVLVVPMLVAITLGSRAAPAADPSGRGAPRAPGEVGGRRIGGPLACAWLGAALLVTVFAVSPYLFLDHRAALADLAVEREHMRLGHFGSDLGPTWLSYLESWWRAVAGPPLALVSTAGFVFLFARRRRAWSPWGWVLGSFVVAYAGLVASFAMKADRYLLPLLPPLVLFAVVPASELCRRLARGPREAAVRDVRPARKSKRAESGGHPARGRALDRAGLALAGVTALLALPALAAIPETFPVGRPDTRTLAKAWIEANVPPGAFVVSEAYGPPLLSPLELQAVDRDLLPALQQRGWQPKLYAVVSLPLFQVAPERSAPFYDSALYRVADAVVVTSSVRDRYRREPARFAAQIALYDTLERSWPVWKEFPANGGAGPAITIFRQPSQATAFAARRPSPGPAPRLPAGAPTGGEAYFYYNLGLNYELFGFAADALPAYLEGLRFGASDPVSATGCAERAAEVLARLGRAADAVALLDRAASGATRPADAVRLRAARARITGGGR